MHTSSLFMQVTMCLEGTAVPASAAKPPADAQRPMTTVESIRAVHAISMLLGWVILIPLGVMMSNTMRMAGPIWYASTKHAFLP